MSSGRLVRRIARLLVGSSCIRGGLSRASIRRTNARCIGAAGILLVIGSLASSPAAFAQAALPDKGRIVAITFDDLPFVGGGATLSKPQVDAAVASQRRIVEVLRRERIPATGFVNESKIRVLGQAGLRLLAEWNRGLLALGNHGHSHLDSNDLDLPAIEREIVTGEASIRPMVAAAGRTIPFFRFPYNHVGNTEPRRVAIEALLTRHGYKLAASTIDTSDYLFDRAYERSSRTRDASMMKRIERAYLEHTRVQIAYYGTLGRQVFGRDVPAIIVLHANLLNAATMIRLLDLFRSAGYRFVSLEQAQSDPIYANAPAVATRFGPMWAYRWARERKVEVNGRLEQEPPAWVSAYGDGKGR